MPVEAIALLRRMRGLPGHSFWSDDVSPTDEGAAPFGRLLSYRQVTDAHLLTLAVRNGGRLATFDRGVPEIAGPDSQSVELSP